jgi:hypothetical protein
MVEHHPTDYDAPAEVYANRRGAKGPLFYRKFGSLAEALRFAVESPPAGAANILIESDEERFEAGEIRRLYDAVQYPLPRPI